MHTSYLACITHPSCLISLLMHWSGFSGIATDYTGVYTPSSTVLKAESRSTLAILAPLLRERELIASSMDVYSGGRSLLQRYGY